MLRETKDADQCCTKSKANKGEISLPSLIPNNRFQDRFRVSVIFSCKLWSQSLGTSKSNSVTKYQSIKTNIIYFEVHC